MFAHMINNTVLLLIVLQLLYELKRSNTQSNTGHTILTDISIGVDVV